MGPYYIHYVDRDGTRLRDIAGRSFKDIDEARAEALRILREIRGSAVAGTFGFMEICDAAGANLAEIHFPT